VSYTAVASVKNSNASLSGMIFMFKTHDVVCMDESLLL
jgi:hypothetical protein